MIVEILVLEHCPHYGEGSIFRKGSPTYQVDEGSTLHVTPASQLVVAMKKYLVGRSLGLTSDVTVSSDLSLALNAIGVGLELINITVISN